MNSQRFDDDISRDRFKLCVLLNLALNLNEAKDEKELKINQCKLLEITYMGVLEFIDNYRLDPEKVLNAVKLNDYLFSNMSKKVDNETKNNEDKNKVDDVKEHETKTEIKNDIIIEDEHK